MKFSLFCRHTGLLLICATSLVAEPPTDGVDSASSQTKPLPVLTIAGQFDTNGDHQLDATERKAARAYLAQHAPPESVPPSGRTAPLPPQAVALEPVKTGEKINPASVSLFPNEPLYDPSTLRTAFLEFEDADWEKELTEFARTDILLPARLTLDGKSYPGVGVHFRVQAAIPATAEGHKRALDLTLDAGVSNQTLSGQRQLRLTDAGSDPTFLRTALFSYVAHQYIAAPLTNFVRVVINGENWGIYVSAQPFDENFIKQNFGTTEGARWSVGPGGNLAYLGDKADAYREAYQLKSPDDPSAWAALIELCKLLNKTPTSELETALAPRLDIDSALKFLALENVLINQDGYGSSKGGFGLYLATDGRFHLIPQDSEASLRLVEQSEYENRPRERPEPKKTKASNGTSDKNDAPKTPEEKALRNYNPKDFPRQSGTDLAMLLSYSFVNKADSDFNGKVTKDEWLTFARSWFLVMDEDLVGKLTHDQFITKFRGLLTPASIADGRTKQTFGREDAAGVIGEDFFKAMDANQDGQLTSQEVTDTFARWFTAWSDPKTAILTEPILQRQFTALFTQSVFQADQTYIAKRDNLPPRDDDARGGRGRGHGGGSGIGVGPLRIGGGGRGGRGGDSRSLVTFSEELDPLAGLDDVTKPMIDKLLAVPSLRLRYLDYVHEITENWFNWSKLGPIAKQYHDLIAADVNKETHKATSYAHFVQEMDQDTTQGSRDGDAAPSLKNFVTERRNYLLKDDRVQGRADSP
jgi:hypothetical protein